MDLSVSEKLIPLTVLNALHGQPLLSMAMVQTSEIVLRRSRALGMILEKGLPETYAWADAMSVATSTINQICAA
jgi:hypothetical protein